MRLVLAMMLRIAVKSNVINDVLELTRLLPSSHWFTVFVEGGVYVVALSVGAVCRLFL